MQLGAYVSKFGTLVGAAVVLMMVGANPALAQHSGGGRHGGGWHEGFFFGFAWGLLSVVGLSLLCLSLRLSSGLSLRLPLSVRVSLSLPQSRRAGRGPGGTTAKLLVLLHVEQGVLPLVSSRAEAWQQVPAQPPK